MSFGKLFNLPVPALMSIVIDKQNLNLKNDEKKMFGFLEVNRVWWRKVLSAPSSHRPRPGASLWSECGQREGFVTVHNAFQLHHVTDSAGHQNIPQERQHSRGHQTYHHGIRLQVLPSHAPTSVPASPLSHYVCFLMPGQSLNVAMWHVPLCSKVMREAHNSSSS